MWTSLLTRVAGATHPVLLMEEFMGLLVPEGWSLQRQSRSRGVAAGPAAKSSHCEPHASSRDSESGMVKDFETSKPQTDFLQQGYIA